MISFSAMCSMPNGCPVSRGKLRDGVAADKQIIVMAASKRIDGSRLLRLSRLDRTARLFPGAEAAGDMGDGLHAHLLRGMRGKRRAQASRAKEDVFLVLGKDRLVIL